MKLSTAATYFDRTIARDAYNHKVRIKCQLEPFDYVKIDGASVKRRVMSTAPKVAIPQRGVIQIDEQRYLVGDSSLDHWDGEPLRARYVLQGADHVVEIRSIAQVLADQPGVQAYASIDFNKYGTDERDSSEYHPQYHIFFAGAELVPENSILSSATGMYLVRNSYRTMAGLMDALSNELDDPIADVLYGERTYDPITDGYIEGGTPTRAIIVRWQDHFAYLSQGSTKYERGDGQALVPMSVAPKPGDTLTIRGEKWKTLSRIDFSDYRSLHIRRA